MEVLHISCNMDTRDLPEMYARSPRAAPSDFGHTFLANHECPCYNYKICTGCSAYISLRQCVYLVNILSQCNM